MCFEQVTSMHMYGRVKRLRLFVLLSSMTYCLPAMALFHNADSSNTNQYRQLKFSDQGRLVVVPDLPDAANLLCSENPVRDLDFPSHGVWDYHPLHPRQPAAGMVVGQSNNLSIPFAIRGTDNFTKVPVVDIVFPWQALEPYIHQTSRTQLIEQTQSPSLSFVPMASMKISGSWLAYQDRLIPAALPLGNASADAQDFPELGPNSYIYLGLPPEPPIERPRFDYPPSDTNIRPYWCYVLPNGDGREYSESTTSVFSEESYAIEGPHLVPEILYANRISLEPRIGQNFRVDWTDSLGQGQVIKASFHRNKPVEMSCLEFPQAVPLYFTVSNFQKFLEGKCFDFKQARALARQPYKPNLEAIRQQRLSEQADLKQIEMSDNYSCVRSLYYAARRLTREYLDTSQQESFYYPLITDEIRGQIKSQDINKKNEVSATKVRALLYKNAELYLKEAIETIKRPIFGPITQNADFVLNVARVYVDLGQFMQAEKLYQMMTLEFARQPYWVDSYENRRLLEQYAELLCKTGREIEAEQKYDQVRQIARQQRKNN